MTSTDPERERDLLRTLSQATDNLDTALADVIQRATDARAALAAGNRTTGGISSLLGHAPANVEQSAGRVEALIQALSIIGVSDEEAYLQAYRPRRR